MAAWTPSKLVPKHHEIIRQKFLGFDNKEIAINLGMSHISVHLILKSQLAQAELGRLKAEAESEIVDGPSRVQVLQKINQAAVASLDYNSKIASGEINSDPKLRVKVTTHFLDRTFFRQHEEEEQTGTFKDLLRGMRRIEDSLTRDASTATVIPTYKEVSS